MSAGWKVGDLALCVDARPHPLFGDGGLTVGAVLTVVAIGVEMPNVVVGRGRSLWFSELSTGNPGYNEHRFRKIKPDAHEDCEPEFVTLLQRIKRPVTA